MTRDEAVSFIADRLGDRTGLTTKIQNELKVAQTRLERSAELPWFLLAQPFATTVAGDRGLATPTGFLREYEDLGLIIRDDATLFFDVLDKLDVGALTKSEIFNTSGKPTDYYLFGSSFGLAPIPDAAYLILIPSYIADTVLSTNIENNWLKHAPDVMIGEAGYWIARYLRDPEATQYFMEYRNEGIRRMQVDNEARKQAAAAAFMGG